MVPLKIDLTILENRVKISCSILLPSGSTSDIFSNIFFPSLKKKNKRYSIMKKLRTMCRVLFPNSRELPPIFFKVVLVNSTAEFFASVGSSPKFNSVVSIKSVSVMFPIVCSIESTEIFLVRSNASFVNSEVMNVRGIIITSTMERSVKREDVFLRPFVRLKNLLYRG